MTNEGQLKCPRGTAACYVPIGRTLYVDKSAELGMLAPILYHEVLHSLDGDQEQSLNTVVALRTRLKAVGEEILNRVARRLGKSPAELGEAAFTDQDMQEAAQLSAMAVEAMEVGRFRTERLAYNGGFRVESELVQLFPAYYRGVGQRLHWRIPNNFPDGEIVVRYGLNRSIIAKFLRGQCQEIRPF